jgi:hypothetical protein
MNGFEPNAKMSSTCHYSHGGAVMKKAKGGIGRGEGAEEDSGTLRMEKMPSGAQQYIRGSTRPEKEKTAQKYTKYMIDKMNAEGTDDFDNFFKDIKKTDKLIDARIDNNAAYSKEIDEKYGYKTGGKIMKKATGGAMSAKRIANPNMPRPMGGVMGNGPFGPRNPNGPRKPMGSPSPMSGGLSSLFKGPMARKKGGMAKGNK